LEWRQFSDLIRDLCCELMSIKRDVIKSVQKPFRRWLIGRAVGIARIQALEHFARRSHFTPHNELNQSQRAQGHAQQQEQATDTVVIFQKQGCDCQQAAFQSVETILKDAEPCSGCHS
jgi:hypothetical protein